MSATILSGDFTISYKAENRQKSITWTGSSTGTRTVNELYSALQDLFDDLTQLDDGTPMSAQTPTEYTIGIIDTGDNDPWFIDRVTVEHLTGGALKTASWARDLPGDGTGNTGIVKVTCNNTSIVSGDIGENITHADGDAGTLLDVKGTGAGSILWIRPDSNALANDWNSTAGTITCNAHTAVQSAAADTGETLWANIFTLGTIETNTHMYIEQNASLLTKYKDSTVDWWEDGQIDILVNVKEIDVENDEGVIKVFARQHSKTYAFFEVDLTSGGRNPIPLQTGDDLDNTLGYRSMVLTDASADFTVGEIIQDTSEPTVIQGIVTSNSGTAPNTTIEYYLIGDPLTDFGAGTGAFSGTTSSSTGTAVAPSDVNAATSTHTDVVVTHANTGVDVDENDTSERYSITVDCSDETLQVVQEELKYVTRRGDVATGRTDGQAGQFYLGSDYRLEYTALSGTISEGDVVGQLVSGATGTVVAHHTTEKILILRSSRGTFADDGSAGTKNVQISIAGVLQGATNQVSMDDTSSTATAITPIASSPFGTFAGGKFFGAPGVVLINVASADATNYQLVDDTGTVVLPPAKVSVTVANTRSQDRVAIFRLASAGGIIDKTEYAGTVQIAGVGTIIVGSSIATDVPGKTLGGVLRVVDVTAFTEYRLRYTSWSGSTFTLSNTTGTTTATSSTTVVTDSGATFTTTAVVGDLVYNSTAGAYGYVVSVDSDTQLTTTTITGAGASGDAYEINALPVATTASDYVYIPILDSYESTGTDASTGSESVTVTYGSNIPVRVVTRNATDTASTSTPMLPYTADATVTSTGLTNNVIRTLDSIKT